jgi:Zn-finger nucleic acid-binding protein
LHGGAPPKLFLVLPMGRVVWFIWAQFYPIEIPVAPSFTGDGIEFDDLKSRGCIVDRGLDNLIAAHGAASGQSKSYNRGDHQRGHNEIALHLYYAPSGPQAARDARAITFWFRLG